jgi:hypothetical protein
MSKPKIEIFGLTAIQAVLTLTAFLCETASIDADLFGLYNSL